MVEGVVHALLELEAKLIAVGVHMTGGVLEPADLVHTAGGIFAQGVFR